MRKWTGRSSGPPQHPKRNSRPGFARRLQQQTSPSKLHHSDFHLPQVASRRKDRGNDRRWQIPQLPVTFKSGGILAGSYEATIEINGNDPQKPSFEVPVSLAIEATRTLTVNPSSVEFGEVSVGAMGEQTVQVTNSGNAAVTISQIDNGNGVFTASASSKPLLPGETSSLLFASDP